MLPDEERQWLQLRLRDLDSPGEPLLLESRIALSELGSRRLSLAYLPATVEDQHLANALGGYGAFPAHLVRLRPSLLVETDVPRPGTGIVEAGSRNKLEVVFQSPAGELRYEQRIAAGTVAGLAIDTHGDGALDPEPETGDAPSSGPPAATLLNRFAQRYLAEWSQADADSAAVLGLRLLRPLPALALALPQVRSEGSFGLVDRFIIEGVALDAGLRPVEPVSLRAANADEFDWLRLSALHGSALESQLFAQLWAVDAISADAALRLAVARDIDVLRLTPASGIQSLGAHAPAVQDAVGNWLGRGFDVQIPRLPLEVEAWRGSAWRVENPATGESGYFLSGSYAGGATVIPPGLWYFQDLANALADPYALPPNDDPLAGVVVQISSASQLQTAEAGQWLERPLEAFVTDRDGFPVQGARVHFVVRAGDAMLQVGGGGEAGAVTALSDHRGRAEVRMRAPTRLAGLNNGLILMPGDRFPRASAVAAVEVVVDTHYGPLTPGEPYFGVVIPGPAVRIAFDRSGFLMTAGVGPGLAWLHALDQYDNPVSNLDVAFSTADTYAGPPCAANHNVAGTGVFLVGACPPDQPVFAWSACVSDSVSATTTHQGIPLQFAPTARQATQFSLIAESDAGTALSQGSTIDAIRYEGGVCEVRDTFGLMHTAVVDPLQSALLGMRVPYPRQFQMYRDPGGVGRIDHFWTPSAVDASSISVQAEGGSATPPRLLAAHAFEFDLIAGATPSAITGTVRALPLVPEPPQLQTAFRRGWAVELPPAEFQPALVELDAFQAAQHPFRVTAPLLPMESVPR